MELALIGLGKMGLNIATRLVRGGHRVVVYARTKESVEAAIKNGAEGASSLEEAVGKLTSSPKAVWVMVPAGATTTDTIDKVSSFLKAGDIIIDGGNSNYKDTIKHAEMLEAKGIDFVDCGTSGGIWGLTEGYSLMIGGKPEDTEKMRPIVILVNNEYHESPYCQRELEVAIDRYKFNNVAILTFLCSKTRFPNAIQENFIQGKDLSAYAKDKEKIKIIAEQVEKELLKPSPKKERAETPKDQPESNQKISVFLNYTPEDKRLVKNLYEDLGKEILAGAVDG